MTWDFSTDPEYQEKLDWARTFVKEKVVPLDYAFPKAQFTRPMSPELKAIVDPLKQEVKDHGLWATQLGPDLGGQGYGQLKLALLHEVIGITNWGASIFGTMAPDTGNAEILAAYGTEDQKSEYLQPLLGGDIVSCFAMTEPLGGADPSQFTTQAVRDGEEWVLTGDKYWASHARWAEFLIVMAVTDPDAPLTSRMSMFIVPKNTPGMTFVHQTGLWGDGPDDGAHALIEFRGARVPADSILGRPGEAFAVSQTRLGGGRLHAAMRAIGSCQKAIDMMAERALSRRTKGELLADKQAVQMDIANSYAELAQFRLYVLYTAWQYDQTHDWRAIRKDVSAIQILVGKVIHDIARRAVHMHGALGISNELPLMQILHGGEIQALTDGPTEVHQVVLSKLLLREYTAGDPVWPSEFLPHRREQARKDLGLA